MNDVTPVKQMSDWKRFFLLIFIVLPVIAIGAVCAYGFIVWFGQILFWGPPS